jgi:hypothetical protein
VISQASHRIAVRREGERNGASNLLRTPPRAPRLWPQQRIVSCVFLEKLMPYHARALPQMGVMAVLHVRRSRPADLKQTINSRAFLPNPP